MTLSELIVALVDLDLADPGNGSQDVYVEEDGAGSLWLTLIPTTPGATPLGLRET